MSVCILIPVRPFGDGKQRLAGVLDLAERSNLNRWFFQHTLRVAATVVGAANCIVVSQSPALLTEATDSGAIIVAEPEGAGLNGALAAASETARSAGATTVLALSCDLPFLESADVAAMLAAVRPGTIVVAPDEAGTGTNALAMSPIGVIDYRYGEQSLAAHLAASAEAGFHAEIVRRPGLARDIDTPADLTRLRQHPLWQEIAVA